MNKPYVTKEEKTRQFILNESLYKVVLRISLPLILYGLFNYLYSFFDIILSSYIGGNEVASVVFIEEIKNAIVAFGASIAAGGTVIVARHFGSGNIQEARRSAGNAFVFTVLISVVLVSVTLFFGKDILLLLNAPEEVITVGLGYFNVQMIVTTLIAINSVYFGLEKAKGNTKRILIMNIFAMILKMILSVIFVYVMGKGTMYIALATMISQLFLVVVAMFAMFDQKNIFHLVIQEIRLKKSYLLPIITMALPVFAGKFLFSIGKIVVNGMAATYGPLALAALGITMKIGGGAGSLGMVFEESEVSIVSINLGNRQLKRAVDTYKITHLYALGFASFGLIIMHLLLPGLITFFSQGKDPQFAVMIQEIFKWERFSALTSSSIAIITAMFIGFKLPRVSFILNVSRLFVFRIPLLWLMIFLEVDYMALGYVMFISNLATFLVALAMMVTFMVRIYRNGYQDMALTLS